ncbi:MAG TPA: hypothetical protein VGQ17_17125 [Gemmatimonadales bacterium]|nr:hypothetical protein [Gemmatimonadales bacterium]
MIHFPVKHAGVAASIAITACGGTNSTAPTGPVSFQNNPCIPAQTVQLDVAQTTLLDCSGGGATVSFAGNGASYLVVAQFAGSQGPNQPFNYSLASGTLAPAPISARRVGIPSPPNGLPALNGDGELLAPPRPFKRQMAFEGTLLAQARARFASGTARAAILRPPTRRAPLAAVQAPPPVGSVRSFQVLSSLSPSAWKPVGAKLAVAGSNLLVYVDTLAPANGFTASDLQAFSQYFDQTLYDIVVGAFGPPTDLDQNGRVIMLLSPIVNAISPAAQCATQGFVAGFFSPDDLTSSSHSNQGEIFYSVVPDPNGTVSCVHSVAGVGAAVPATFMHEMQHLINFSQHVVLHGGGPGSSWLDEGLSIAAEELGSLHFEQKCPAPSCRTNPDQLFPDSAQGFVQSFLYDSYQYGLLPDTASLTLNTDDTFGFSWRGGDWLLAHWLGDQYGPAVFQRLEQGPSDGVTDLVAATGQPFQTLFGNFGLALYTDSLPGLPRATAPAADRFLTRNLRQLWARLFITSGGTADIPLAFPVQLFTITSDTSTAIMSPGTMSFFRLDTPATSVTVAIRFSAPGGTALAASLHPQLAVFRLPAGQ